MYDVVEPWKIAIMIHGYRLQKTSFACPEQYEVFDGLNQHVAYFRLRHGKFTACVPDVGGECVYQGSPNGDGIFNDEERVTFLTAAILSVQEYYVNCKWRTDELM